MTDNTQAELPPNAQLDPNSILAPAPGEVEQAVIVAAMIAKKHFTIDEAYAYLAAYTNRRMLDARISTLKKLKNTRPNAELDDQTSDYLRGYREMESKIGFELNRLKKLKESSNDKDS